MGGVKFGCHHQSRSSSKRSGGIAGNSDPALTGTTAWDGAVVLSHYLTETSVLQQHMAQQQREVAARSEEGREEGGPGQVGTSWEVRALSFSIVRGMP